MLRSYSYSPSYGDGILSILDIGAVLLCKKTTLPLKGLDYDMKQLSDDRAVLETDFRNTSTRLQKESISS